MSTTVTYKGSTLTTVENATKKLTTAGTWLEDDITIQDSSSSGGSVVVVDTPDSHGGTIREITAQNTVMLQNQKSFILSGTPQTITPDTGYDGFASAVITDNYDVMFYDYDGTVLYGYSKAEFLALTEMPANPSHTGLTAEGWNWTLANAKTHVTNYGILDIGQVYKTDDGKTKFYITIDNDSNTAEDDIPFKIGFRTSALGNTVIDWGDGTSETTTGAANTNTVYTHTYSTNGDYVVQLTTSTGTVVFRQCIYGDIYKDRAVNALRFKKVEMGENARGYSDWDNFSNCYELETFIIPNEYSTGGTTKWLGRGAFRNCLKLKHLTIPDGFTHIGDTSGGGQGNFYYCISLQSISFPSTMTNTYNQTFQNCFSLKRATIPAGITAISNNLFNGCKSLKRVVIPSTVTSIGNTAFSGCRDLEEVTIPSGVTAINGSAFSTCGNLKKVTVLAAPTIASSAFEDCVSLEEISFPTGVTALSDYTFRRCYSLEKVTLPSSVVTFGNGVFTDCYNLQSISDVSNLTSQAANAFAYCYSLKSIVISEDLTTINAADYRDCRTLKNVTIPSGITSIADNAFIYCTNLESIHILATSPPTLANARAFNYTNNCPIYVPYSADHSILNAYQTGTNWSTHSSRMQEEPQS